MQDRFDIAKLTQDPLLVARIASAEDLFGFFTREVAVPPACVALVYGSDRHPALLSAGTPLEAGEIREVLFVRTAPFFLEYAMGGLRSSDGFAFDATIQLSVQVVPERIELEAFRRTILGSRREARTDRLRQQCETVVRQAAGEFVTAGRAGELISSNSWEAFDEVLEKAFAGVGFESGIALGSDARITLHSPTYEESRREIEAAAKREERDQAERSRREAAAKAREAHLSELAGILEKAKSMAGANGGLHVADIIRTFDVGQRGALYHGLLATHKGMRATSHILAVAGGELLWIDPTNLEKPQRRQILPSDAGSLRSVRVDDSPGGRQILIGAKRGVFLLNENGENARSFSFTPPAELRGGVNSAAVCDNFLFASHSEVGLVQWKIDQPATTMRLCLTDLTEGSKAVRDVQTDGAGRLWLGIDNIVVGWNPQTDAPQFTFQAPSEITTLLVEDDHAIAGLRDGSIVRWLIGDTKAKMETVRPAQTNPVQSIDWLAGGGIPRLLVGDGRPQLDLHVFGDSYTGQYRCLHEIKWGLGADDLIAAVTDRRDHLLVWSPETPELPRAAMAVRRITGRSIQDVALL